MESRYCCAAGDCIQQPMDLLHGVVDFHIEIPLAERRASPVIPLLILCSAR